MKKLILYLVLIITILESRDFIPSQDDPTWNYQFDTYTKYSGQGAGIKDENITTAPFSIDENILNTFLYALPESSQANIDHPEYFPANEPEIALDQKADAFVTFYSEGAGYKNTLGYYTYDGDTGRTAPSSVDELKEHGKIIFPNTSFVDSGGQMYYGLTVSLGEFEANTKFIFFIVSNGWTGTGIRDTDWIFSTKSDLNLEYDPDSILEVPNHKHVALLWSNVGAGNILLMGFEDILRTHASCDHDFNDVLFSFATNPMNALVEENGSFSVAPVEADSDNDGVSDAFDEFINDPERAYTTYYPNQNDKATIMYEDMWPKEGDYDMNDLSIEIQIVEIKDSLNKIKEIQFDSRLKTNGAAYKNGFAIQINSPMNNIESSEFFIDGIKLETNLIADEENTIITFFTDAVKEFKKTDSYYDFAIGDKFGCNDPYNRFINVCLNRVQVSSPNITGSIIFINSVDLISPPYNPFLIVNNGVLAYNEVHLPNYMPTSLAPTHLFNTMHDASNLNLNITYKTSSDKPWALLIPRSFAYPLERKNISNVYKYYNAWVNSGGEEYSDWYLHNKVDEEDKLYANPDLIYLEQ
ncbi:MAG: LruC domain-containing protein [Campylobacteraceae bacterium]|nr:LruC domain-containing protein [Campylobacteraceae bacterium]